jgi:hypothetical protein
MHNSSAHMLCSVPTLLTSTSIITHTIVTVQRCAAYSSLARFLPSIAA